MAHQEDPEVVQLQQELIEKDKKIKNAILIAGQHQARVLDLEELFDNKNDVKEKAANAIEKEEQNNRERALQQDNEQLQQETSGLRRKEARLVAKVDDLGEILRKRGVDDVMKEEPIELEDENQALNETPAVPKEEPMDSEDDNQISTRDSMEEEEQNGDVEISEMDGGDEEVDMSLDQPPIDNDESIQMVHSDFNVGDMTLDGEMDDVREPAVSEIDSLEMDNIGNADGMDQSEVARRDHEDSTADDQIEREEEIDNTNGKQKVSSVEGEIELRSNRKPSKRASKSVKYNESLVDSDEDEAPPVKKLKLEANNKKKIVKKTSSSNKESSQSKSSKKESKVVKLNETDLECPECEYRTRSVAAWRAHLGKIHSTTPKQAGFALRCDCGVDCFSDTHFLTCERANAVVIKIEDKKESELVKMNDSELKCPECEHSTRSVMGWVAHLKDIHSTTPNLAGLALRCDCGHEGLSEKHSRSCESTNTTVILKRDMKKKDTPQCIRCKAYPTTASAYQLHLKRRHKTTLKAQGIYLKCSCNCRITSNTRSIRIHDKQCESRQFSLHKLSED